MREYLEHLLIKFGFKRPKYPSQRIIPIGPISKKHFHTETYSLKTLYGNNEIVTSRYTWYGFLFQNFGEQAQRVANFYFICIAIIQIFTDTPITPAASIAPLLFVFLVSMVKQGYEDFLRHCADRSVNKQPIEIVTETGTLSVINAMDITVGDVILCRNNSTFPCDLILLSSSESNGECFITTTSLDGETNLKKFLAIKETIMYDSPEILVSELRGEVCCQQPTENLYMFAGKVTLANDDDNSVKELPLATENLLLRGACLRNTDFIYGCAVYTGQDTKLALNSQGKKTKFSQIERKLNVYLIFIITFLLVCVIITTILNFEVRSSSKWYVIEKSKTIWLAMQQFLGFIVLFNVIIPISLYVTIEVQKFVGSKFFEWDINLYDSRIDEKAKANTSDLIEEMGQVEYLFTDKTGTLTENTMQFRKLATASGIFELKGKHLYQCPEALDDDGELGSEFDLDVDEIDEEVMCRSPSAKRKMSGDVNNEMNIVDLFGPTDNRNKLIVNNSIQALLIQLALCHNVRVERRVEEVPAIKGKQSSKKPLFVNLHKHSPPKRGVSALRRASAALAATEAFRASKRGRKVPSLDYDYQASSPDEKAFVETTRELGIIYHGQDQSGFYIITIQGEALRYRQLDMLEFDATRKCMSVILQYVSKQDQTGSLSFEAPVIVLCKGAETTMLNKLDKSTLKKEHSFNSGDPLVDCIFGTEGMRIGMDPSMVMNRVTEFATDGLRTLVMGIRFVSMDEWNDLKSELDCARASLDNREARLSKVYWKIESKLTLIGCTGVEDMLQEGVPETISALRDAGIQVWVLTGDKEETAVNISYAAKHFFAGMELIRITKQVSIQECAKTLRTQLHRMRESRELMDYMKFGVVIDGHSLNFALEHPLRDDFINCCKEACTMLCCRLTPIQKAEVVRLVKESEHPQPITAAIGDGANDVSMILEAHVGFGLYGKEGRQAVGAADYAFGRFRFLRQSLLVHGHCFCIRVSNLILYFFYKNLTFVLPQMMFSFLCSFSGQPIYPELYLILFNVTMSSLPIFLYGIFEQPINPTKLYDVPLFYKFISKNKQLCLKNFVLWYGLGVWHALVAFIGPYLIVYAGTPGGLTNLDSQATPSNISDIYSYGHFVMVLVFFIVNIKVFLISYVINRITIVLWFVSVICNLTLFIAFDLIFIDFAIFKQFYQTWVVIWIGQGCATAWSGLVGLTVLSLLPDLVIRVLQDQYRQWKLDRMQLDIRRQKWKETRMNTLRQMTKRFTLRSETSNFVWNQNDTEL